MRASTKISALSAVLLVLFANPLSAQDPVAESNIAPEKEQAVRAYLDLTRVAELIVEGMEQMMPEQMPPDLPEDFMEVFKRIAREEVPGLIDMLVPVYAGYATLEEFEGLIEFYRSPLGQRQVEIDASVSTEMMPIGERWGMVVMGRVFTELANRKP